MPSVGVVFFSILGRRMLLWVVRVLPGLYQVRTVTPARVPGMRMGTVCGAWRTAVVSSSRREMCATREIS